MSIGRPSANSISKISTWTVNDLMNSARLRLADLARVWIGSPAFCFEGALPHGRSNLAGEFVNRDLSSAFHP